MDNAKALIAKALAFELAVQRTCAAFCAQNGMAVVNARVRRPKDMSKAEFPVQVVQR